MFWGILRYFGGIFFLYLYFHVFSGYFVLFLGYFGGVFLYFHVFSGYFVLLWGYFGGVFCTFMYFRDIFGVPDAVFGLPRCPWARARALLLSGGGPSSAALGLLEASPFVVAFDPSPPNRDPSPQNRDPPPEERDPPRDGDLDREAKALLLGPPHNR